MGWRSGKLEIPRAARGGVPLLLAARDPIQAVLGAGLRAVSHRGAPVRQPASPSTERHPLAPAAVRVERTRSRRGGDNTEQTAVTMWFGNGPALPAPGRGSPALRATLRLGAGMVGAAAVAAATAVAARRNEQRLSASVAGPRARLSEGLPPPARGTAGLEGSPPQAARPRPLT